jgi:hypothetical protein
MQCRFIIDAARELANVSDKDLVPGFGLTDPYWEPIQTILVSAANLSKMFWGDKPTAAARRRPLRRSLRVTKRSPLYSRALRNHFEHFDEKLEGWFRSTPHGNYAGRNVSPTKEFSLGQTKRFAHYDPDTGKVTFWGHSMVLDRLVQEAARIRLLAEAESLKF